MFVRDVSTTIAANGSQTGASGLLEAACSRRYGGDEGRLAGPDAQIADGPRYLQAQRLGKRSPGGFWGGGSPGANTYPVNCRGSEGPRSESAAARRPTAQSTGGAAWGRERSEGNGSTAVERNKERVRRAVEVLMLLLRVSVAGPRRCVCAGRFAVD
ncbi:hypothetical protein BCR34DRAFT_249628 [Clohesyomyces aquaticus]|uniref:Uncharacterized protein n=1 Tax=Clohesyomyces aquaticus TaxID=1231657 RepID=A0A1Y1ZUP4_9PLEO|nr:hypothetical protein BCR34DRAFT_249628 [Clohesyomyces aquaticus]